MKNFRLTKNFERIIELKMFSLTQKKKVKMLQSRKFKKFVLTKYYAQNVFNNGSRKKISDKCMIHGSARKSLNQKFFEALYQFLILY